MKKRTDPLLKLGRLAGKAVTDFDMIRDGDRLLVGISGGVDSMMLMHVLQRMQQRAPLSFELFAVTVSEGFAGIDHTPLTAYAGRHGWNLKILDTPIAQLIAEKGNPASPCGLCARLRRGAIHGYADKINCNKLVLGHHRDDLCASLLMSLFRGRGIKTMSPNIAADSGTKQLIRPLCYAPKKLIESSAAAYDFPTIGTCDYSGQLDCDGDRAAVERLFQTLEDQFPDIGNAMLHSMSDIRPETLLDRRFL